MKHCLNCNRPKNLVAICRWCGFPEPPVKFIVVVTLVTAILIFGILIYIENKNIFLILSILTRFIMGISYAAF